MHIDIYVPIKCVFVCVVHTITHTYIIKHNIYTQNNQNIIIGHSLCFYIPYRWKFKNFLCVLFLVWMCRSLFIISFVNTDIVFFLIYK